MLKRAIKHGHRESIHIKLASIYRSMGKFSEALSQYHAVLGISPHSREATTGLQDLENLIKQQKYNALHTGGSSRPKRRSSSRSNNNMSTPIQTPPSMTRSGSLF